LKWTHFIMVAELAATSSLVPCRAGEASSPIQVRDGRPCLLADGKLLSAIYSDTFPWDARPHQRNRDFAKAGVQLFLIQVQGNFHGDFATSYFWRDDGAYGDESDRDDKLKDLTLDRQAAEILAVRPEAYFIVRMNTWLPKGWIAHHQNQMQLTSGGKRIEEPSFASESYIKDVSEAHRRTVEYCEARPWGSRILGYLLNSLGEGLSMLSLEGSLFDQAEPMQKAFANFVRERYTSDDALRQAWNDLDITMEKVRTPTDESWQKERAAWLHWPKPEQTRRYRDYFELQRKVLRTWLERQLSAIRLAAKRPVIVASDSLKQPMLGWQIQDAFFAAARGPTFANMHLASGSIGVGPLLDNAAFDVLLTPADYTARSVGFGFEPEGLSDSLVLRGKSILVEDDARSWATNERTTQGAWRNPAEARAGLLRNFGAAASRGLFPYWMNVGRGFFDDPKILALVAEQVPLRATIAARPLRHTEHAIALIIDDESPMDEDFTSGFQNLAVLRQRVDELALTGLPYRTYLFSDIARDDFPQFRACLLPNLFRLTPERIALIRKKLMRSGSVIIFGPGTGVTDGHKVSAQPAAELLGFPVELVEKQVARRVLIHAGAHPALTGISAGRVYGDSLPFGPLLQPASNIADSHALELGKLTAYWGANCAGLVLRSFGRGAVREGEPGPRAEGDCAVVFSTAAPLPAELLRALALYGGCVAWSALGDVVSASGDLLCVHSLRAGQRTIQLPGRFAVTDALSGKQIAKDNNQFETVMESPDTRIFLLDPPDKK